MNLIEFVAEAAAQSPYGTKGSFLPGIWGRFEANILGAASEEVNGILVGAPIFRKGVSVAFEPIGYVQVNDRGSHEYLIVGVDALNPPTFEKTIVLFEKVLKFSRENFLVGSWGQGPEAVKQLTDNLLSK